MPRYVDAEGRIYFVSDGIGGSWGTYTRKSTGGGVIRIARDSA